MEYTYPVSSWKPKKLPTVHCAAGDKDPTFLSIRPGCVARLAVPHRARPGVGRGGARAGVESRVGRGGCHGPRRGRGVSGGDVCGVSGGRGDVVGSGGRGVGRGRHGAGQGGRIGP